MDNQLNPESIISNLSSYRLDTSHLELVCQIHQPQNNTAAIWKHRTNGMRLVQKKHSIKTWLQFYDLLQMFALRYNDPYLLATKYLNTESDLMEKLSNSNVFSDTWISIFYEESISNLRHFKQIPQEDAPYFMLQSLKGFGKLLQKIKFPFEVKECMFHINQQKQIKVWLCQQEWQSKRINQMQPLASQYQMAHQILLIIQKNIYFCTDSQKSLSQKTRNLMQPIVIKETIRKAPQTIDEAISLVEKHLENDEVQVRNQMSCLRDIYQNQFKIMVQLTKLQKYPSRPLNQSLTYRKNCMIQNNFKPFSQNVVHIQNPSYFYPESYRSDLFTQPIPIKIQRNLSLQNMNSTIRVIGKDSSISVSREKSNKKSGISLVKKNQPKQMSENRNHTSMMAINSKNHQNFKKPSIIITANSVKRTESKNEVKTSKQKYQFANPFVENKKYQLRRDSSLSNVQSSKGITVTHRNESLKKSKNTNMVKNLEKKKIKLSLQNTSQRCGSIMNNKNENKSWIQNKASTITIGSFPPPLYVNNSLIRLETPNETFSHNFTNQTISLNMSFDPLIPNQSLTRFHKEFITNLNANSSGQEFYEVPKIYVHSPKAKSKIFKMDVIKSEINQHENQRFINQFSNKNISNPTAETKFTKDQVKQWGQQNIQRKNSKLEEYQSYIVQNQSVFTHPTLYEYITSNSNEFNEMQKVSIQKKKPYIDHLSNVQISESLDYNTTQKLFEAKNQHNRKQKLKNLKDFSPQHFSINDFPTIEQIEENPNDEIQEKQNISFLPIPLNLAQTNGVVARQILNQQPPSSVRRGYEESVVVEYKKFFDDTNRSNNSPNKHYFSPLKKNNIILNQYVEPQKFQEKKKYATTSNWRTSPSKAILQRPSSFHNQIHQNIQAQQIQYQNGRSQSPLQKIIYRGERPAINPLLMQDIQKIRQHQMY